MRMQKTVAVFLLAGLLSVLGYLTAEQADAQSNSARMAAEAQFTEGGTAQCLSCHGGDKMAVMADTPHGNLDTPHTPYAQQGCESCHGPGSIHVSRVGGGAGRPILLSFEGTGDVPAQNAACQNCHAQQLGELDALAWEGSLHATADMSCQDCHQSHSLERPMADQATQQANCAGCHRRQIDSHPRFENAGILFDTLSCSTCHNVHELEAGH